METTNKVTPVQLSFNVVQDAYGQVREMVGAQMRSAALKLVQSLFVEEVARLCGPRFSRKDEDACHRGGSDPGSVILDGQRVAVKKPRIRKNGKDVPLVAYGALQGFDLLCEKVMGHMLSGVSTRNYDGLLNAIEGGVGLAKSSVSKAFIRGCRQALDQLNGRTLSGYDFIAMMVDGIEFAGRCVVVAMGITTDGEKLILGLKEGDTENSEVCKDLLQNLLERGLARDRQLLFVLDGSKALKKAVRKVFGEDFPIQRCIRHKERNCLSYLPEQHHLEFRRRWKLLHGLTRFDEAKLEYERLTHWLGRISDEAATSLAEAEMETLTVIRLKAPAMLRKTLASTNPLESVFCKVRNKCARVKRWRGGDHIIRWSAATLLDAEKKLRLIRGYKEIPVFLAEIRRKSLSSAQMVA